MKKTMLIASSVMMMNLLMVSCNLDDGSSCPEALTGGLSDIETEFVGTWVLTNMVSEEEVDLTDDDVENPSTEIFQQLPDCQKDVVYDFESDRKFTLEQEYNATDCQNKLTFDGTWKLTEGKLTFVSQCTSQTIDIVVNDDSTMFTLEDTYFFNDVNGFVISTSVTLTYEKTL
jgi:hypothetical protein